jgi:hypothetical protein
VLKVVVPHQCNENGAESPWCMHEGDNGIPDASFEHSNDVFIEEYAVL